MQHGHDQCNQLLLYTLHTVWVPGQERCCPPLLPKLSDWTGSQTAVQPAPLADASDPLCWTPTSHTLAYEIKRGIKGVSVFFCKERNGRAHWERSIHAHEHSSKLFCIFVYIVTYFKLWHAELFIQYICMQIHTRLSYIVWVKTRTYKS